ncbi:anhydro-N-acetylmuramic acid kinase [Orbaceae bacterium ESL0727]|nr:anhydro-N-acetylmuramic acid kinase [Orbaceae bacterium ESL0727]
MSNFFIGVMSGTSMDGIDLALTQIDSVNQIRLVASDCYPMPTDLKQKLILLCETKQTTLQNLGELDHQLGQLFADSINHFLLKNQIDHQQIAAIGCHGQTVFHSPEGVAPFTLQIGDANIIAAQTQITTIADFRRKDMAYGGQGAPLVPAFHQAILADRHKNRVVVNIGGISNISILIPNQNVTGYDTGPGNLLLDGFIHQQLNQPYDKDATWAKTGSVNHDLLRHCLNDPFFAQLAPKSTGRELFNLTWLAAKLTAFQPLKIADIQATLVELTAQSIANELIKLPLINVLPNELLVCGGGAKNPLIMERLTKLLPNWSVLPTDKLGISGDDMEAMAFAWLAYCRLHRIPSNIPKVTGASQKVSLGVIYQ